MPATPPDPWHFLRDLTAARIALGRTGGSLPTRELLDFSLAHARARDAVHVAFEPKTIVEALDLRGWPSVIVASEADQDTYLRRPDLGRQLDAASRAALHSLHRSNQTYDLVPIISDGLSAPAPGEHAVPLLSVLLPWLIADGWDIAPIVIVRHGRVAIEDEIGELLDARLSLILLGERPGLGSPDSLGAYFVHDPRVGRTDAERNCVSNIRPAGLPIEVAAETLHHLLTQARTRRLSGVGLKDERGMLPHLSPRCLQRGAEAESALQ